MTAKQLPLDLRVTGHNHRADFLMAPSNQAALGLVETWPNWPNNTLLLYGPPASGKSHLAQIAADISGAPIHAAAELGALNWSALTHVILEDGPVARANEEDLFHLINWVRENGGSLFITSQSPPSRWGTQLPDLASRLNAMTSAELLPPDDVLLEQVLAKTFDDLGATPTPQLLSYLVARIERSFEAAQACAVQVNAESLARKSPVSRKIAKLAMGW